jgi:hypothetical protein
MSGHRIGHLDQAAIDGLKRLRTMQDIADQVGRPPGDLLTITRQDLDDLVDGMRFVSRRFCEMAGGV